MTSDRPMPVSFGKRAMFLIQIAVVAYLGYTVLFFMMQRRMVYPGAYMSLGSSGTTASVTGLEKIWFTTSVGRVEAWYIPARSENGSERSPAVIFTHGNAELIDEWPEDLNRFAEMGVGVLMVEYPGYGRSEGSPSQRSVMEAVTAGYDWLVKRDDVDSTRIVAMGRSLGGGPAVALTGERAVSAVILQSAFSSVGAIAWGAYKLPPFLVLDQYDNRRALSSFSGPVLVVHGRRDDVIPYGHGVLLADVAENGKLITLECAHSDCPPSWEDFFDEISRFLSEAGIIER